MRTVGIVWLLFAVDSSVGLAQDWFFREAIIGRSLSSFNDLLRFFTSQPSAAPMYVMMAGAGKGEGAIVSFDPFRTLPVVTLAKNATQGWFLIQTNSDVWLPDPDGRRVAADALLKAIGRDAGGMPIGVFAVMSTAPMHGGTAIYVAVMVPSSGAAYAFGQEGISPA